MNIGFIGVGNMGSAMVSGVLNSNIDNINIFIYDKDIAKMSKIDNTEKCSNVLELSKKSDIIVIAVKPQIVKSVLSEIDTENINNKIIVSLALGVTIKSITNIIKNAKIARIMPNTPALVGEGMSIISLSENFDENSKKIVFKILECIGKVELLDEKLMNNITALTGSSPAYMFVFIEAMADAAVLDGIPRSIAYKLAAQSMLGAAKMVIETNEHPASLKDKVCSPAGSTIEAIRILEKNGFRSTVIEAMLSCNKRANEISKLIKE